MNNDKKKGAAGLIVALVIALAALAGIVFLVIRTIQTEQSGGAEQVITASEASTVSTLSSAVESTVSIAESTVDAVEPVSGAEVVESATESATESVDGATAHELELMEASVSDPNFWNGAPKITQQFLTPNEFSRCGDKLDGVHDIVIHYVGNPGTTAAKNVEYFESLQDGSAFASSTFVVGLDGEIIQCLPTDEWSYATKQRNHDTLSIEVCHPDETGQFNEASYWATVDLTAFLCKAFEIGPEHVIRHYDVTEKICPKYYVEHPEAWEEFKQNVKARYDYLVSLD